MKCQLCRLLPATHLLDVQGIATGRREATLRVCEGCLPRPTAPPLTLRLSAPRPVEGRDGPCAEPPDKSGPNT